MNPDQDVILGFAHKLKTDKKHKINPENFPSKIGGGAVWLIPEAVPIPLCEKCKNIMKFLLQIYAPLPDESCYHRVLYVFFCINSKCNRTRESLKVYRCQLPSKNAYYTFPDSITTPLYSKFQPLTMSCLMTEYMIKTEIIEKDEVKQQVFLSEEHVKARLHQNTAAEYEDFEAEQLKQEDLGHEKDLLKEYQQKTAQEEFDDLEEYLTVEKIDKDYERYKFILEMNGNQEILRYSRHKQSKPLWYSEANQWSDKDIKTCECCGGSRIFELQINSTFLNLYKELIEFEWGIITIYTCQKNCEKEGKSYYEELGLVQFSNDDVKMEGVKMKEMEEIKEEKENESLQVNEKNIEKELENLKISKKNKKKKKNHTKNNEKLEENKPVDVEEKKMEVKDDDEDDWE